MWNTYQVDEQFKITDFHSLFKWKYDKDYTFAGESHDFWECVYVIDGSICASGDDRIYDLKKGNIIFHKPLELHKFNITSLEGATLFIFSFSIKGKTDFFENLVLSLNSEQKILINQFFEFLNSFKSLDSSYDRYEKLFKSSKVYTHQVASYISLLLLSIYNSKDYQATTKDENTLIFSQAVNFMNNNIAKTLNVSEIAHHCATSESSLKRIFSKFSGLGVHKYFLTLKINTAANMLKDGLSVTEISEKLAFSSQEYFSFVFKREMGVTPTEYKSKHREFNYE